MDDEQKLKAGKKKKNPKLSLQSNSFQHVTKVETINQNSRKIETINTELKLKLQSRMYQQRRHLYMHGCTKNLLKQQEPKHQVIDPLKKREEQLRNRMCSLRNWEFTKSGRDHQARKSSRESQHSVNFTVLSYNVLAQHLLEEHTYLYRKVEPEALTWDKRGERILREVTDTQADVLCFQEIQSDHYTSFYVPKLRAMGFTGIFKKRTGDKPDGCAIFFRHSKFALKDSRSVEYCKPNVQVLDRDNIGLVALLTPRSLKSSLLEGEEKPFIVVATTHLLYNPRRHDIKLAQLQLLFAELDLLAFDKEKSHFPYHPTILTGDFNLTPNSKIYEFITRGSLQFKGLGRKELTPEARGHVLQNELIPPHLNVTDQCQHLTETERRRQNDPEVRFSTGQLSHKLQLQSVYPHRLNRFNGATEATTFQSEWVTVDYMFHK